MTLRFCMKIAGMLYQAGRWNEARAWATDAHYCRVDRGGLSCYVDLSRQLIQEIREKAESHSTENT